MEPKQTLYEVDVRQRRIQHEGTEQLAVHNTFVRRWSALLALKTTGRLYKQLGVCNPISRNRIVKRGPYVHLTEAATMQFIAKNTSIPVPEVHCAFVHKNLAYIVMERVRGNELPTVWKNLSEKSREHVHAQLKSIMQELRLLKPPAATGVASCTGGSLRDPRMPRSCPRFGPFKTIQEFHLWLREGLQPSEYPGREIDQDWQDVLDMVAKQDGPWPDPVFTHADLNPFNILLRGDQVVSIIDWECSGWYPHYWEYTSAWLSSIVRTGWRASVDKFLDPFPQELNIEATRHKWWGEF